MKASDLFNVSGAVAVVTGAASGMGFCMAEVLAANGAHVVLADINTETLRAAGEQLRFAGFDVDCVPLDIGDFAAVRATIDGVVARHGRLDILFANAAMSAGPGFASPQGEIQAVLLDGWERTMRVNLTGAFATMQAGAAHMKKQRSGSIIVTASIAAVTTSPLPAYAYHAAKAGLAHTVRVAARELGPHNVRCNAIAPGPFATNFAKGRMKDPEAQKLFTSTVPLGRMADPREIQGLALFLASSASSYMTGSIVAIDGGESA